jgi:hypothetical protein
MERRQTRWRAGTGGGSVVSDVLPRDAVSGSEDAEYYGGYLIAESVAPSMVSLIAAAPELLAALEMVRDADNDCRLDGLKTIPPSARAKIDAAIAKAEGITNEVFLEIPIRRNI